MGDPFFTFLTNVQSLSVRKRPEAATSIFSMSVSRRLPGYRLMMNPSCEPGVEYRPKKVIAKIT